MAAERPRGLRVAFYGAMTVLGKEVRSHLETMAFPVGAVHLYDTGAREGSITEYDGEAMIVTRAEEEVAAASDLAFVCDEDDPRSIEYLEWASRGGGAAVDAARATRGRPDVPVVNLDVNPEAAGGGRRIVASPHPVAHPLSTILHRLRKGFDLKEVAATVLRPVSDFGEEGIEELHKQTVGLLNMDEVPTGVFGRRIAFNLVPASLQPGLTGGLDEAVREDVLRVLGAPAPALSVRVIQAPLFYGHCYSLRVRLEERPDPPAIERALALEGAVNVSRGEDDRTPADLAAEPGVWIADVAADGHEPGAYWLWAICDAVRAGAALNAARLAGKLTEVGV